MKPIRKYNPYDITHWLIVINCMLAMAARDWWMVAFCGLLELVLIYVAIKVTFSAPPERKESSDE